MYRHYLTITQRLITRQKGYFFIHISGLVLGLTAVLLAILFIRDETAYDRFHTHADRLFRVNKWWTGPEGERFKTAESPGLMAPTLVQDFPQVEAATHIAPWFDEVLLTHGDQQVTTYGFSFVDTNFLRLFDFEWVKGDRDRALVAPGQLVLTPKLATALFGEEDPLGKVVIGLDDQPYTVSGIVQEAPRQSHLQFDALASWASTTASSGMHDFSFMNNWLGQTVYTYVLLHDPAQQAALNAGLPDFVARYMPNRTDAYDFYLQPLSDIYLRSYDIRYLRGNKYGSAAFLRTFGIIAVLILLIACFNYINISTAKSLQRAREIGVKKVLGARRGQLLGQFLGETLAFVGVAAVLSVILTQRLLPLFNRLFDREIPESLLAQPSTLLFLVAIVLGTTLAAGLFPGVMLSRLRPLGALHERSYGGTGNDWPRQMLTGLQLALSVGLISGALLLNRQFRFMLHKDLGFDKDQVMVLTTPPGVEPRAVAFRSELLAMPGVQSVALCQATIGNGTFGTTVIPEGSEGKEVPVQAFRVDTAFLRTYGMKMEKGRFFTSDRFQADTADAALVVNESLVRLMGWENPLQRTIQFGPDGPRCPVVGVVRDFHFAPVQEAISPIVMFLNERQHNISIRFDSRHLARLLPAIETLWKKYESRHPFQYTFIDQYFAKSYLNEKRMLTVISLFSGIAILIACLGLYGLAAFHVSRRVKEIGIRKVMGATIADILGLFHRRLLVLTGIAFLLGVPVAWYVLRRWLQQYAYTVDLNAGIFLTAGLLTLTIASLAVLGQSWRAARANPVEALRTE